MPTPDKPKRSLKLRIKVAIVSAVYFITTAACALLRPRSNPTPVITCYEMVEPTDTPEPIVECYEAMPVTETPTPTPFDSPLSPLPTPRATPTPEARRSLQEQLLAEDRFPESIARELES